MQGNERTQRAAHVAVPADGVADEVRDKVRPRSRRYAAGITSIDSKGAVGAREIMERGPDKKP